MQHRYFDQIENSGLPTRLINILLSNEIQHVSRLREMTDEEILLLRNIGPDSLQEIRKRLAIIK